MALARCHMLLALCITIQFVNGTSDWRFEDLPSVRDLLINSIERTKDYQTVKVEDLWFLNKLKQFEQPEFNDRPIVGILSQPRSEISDHSYIMASYVKFIEEGGARVVPILFDEPDEITRKKLDRLNGVLLPGSNTNLLKDGFLTPYSLKGKFIIDYVKERNANGFYYPLYAISQGFELLSIVEAPFPAIINSTEAHNYLLNVTLLNNSLLSRLYKDIPKHLADALKFNTIAMFNTEHRIDPEDFQFGGLIQYNVLATTNDRNGLPMVSSVEHKVYPIYGHQFHPEKSQFIWTLFSNIVHSQEAMELSRYFSDLFISECKKNMNRFDSFEEERDHIIENFPVELTKGDLQDIYIFDLTENSIPTPDQKSNVVFVLGGPGSRKTTLSTLLEDEIGYVHISTGDLLREEVAKGGEMADELTDYMKEGKLVSSELMVRLIKKALKGKNHVLLDGFPRDQTNLDEWDRQIGESVNLQFVLYLIVDESAMIERVLERGKTSGRVDDNMETFYKRIEIFKNDTMPVIRHFQEEGKTCELYPRGDFIALIQEAKECFRM